MPITRRSMLGRSGTAGLGLFLAGLFPEVAAAKPQASRTLSAAQREVIALARGDRRTTAVQSRYHAYTFDWAGAAAVLDDGVARVDVVGRDAATTGVVIVNVFVDTVRSRLLFVQHSLVLKQPASSTRTATLRVAFDGDDPVWAGGFTKAGELVPDHNYLDLKTLRSMKQPQSCKSLVGKVCDYAAAGDSILACAVLVETGPGAVACGFALLVISIWGCGRLKHMICD